MSPEKTVIVDGVELTVGEVMTVRVALTSWLADLDEEGLAALGKIGERYLINGRRVLELLIR